MFLVKTQVVTREAMSNAKQWCLTRNNQAMVLDKLTNGGPRYCCDLLSTFITEKSSAKRYDKAADQSGSDSTGQELDFKYCVPQCHTQPTSKTS